MTEMHLVSVGVIVTEDNVLSDAVLVRNNKPLDGRPNWKNVHLQASAGGQNDWC